VKRVTVRVDTMVLWLASHERRLIGIAMLRIVIGAATILYCLADYDRRQFLWGPNSYNSAASASKSLPHWGFSLFLVSNSQAWFELLFHAVILVAFAFMVFGGRWLTVAQAVMMWSLHYRNQDVLEGGDNLAQILIIFMMFACSNAYFAPGSKERRAGMRANEQPSVRTALHNLAAYLIVFQTSVLYLVAGYWKITGTLWQNGVAMYYVSRLTDFEMSSTYAHAMSSAFHRNGLPVRGALDAGVGTQGKHPGDRGHAPGDHGVHGAGLLRSADDRCGLHLPARRGLPLPVPTCVANQR
jgi:small-conductance mechanosensitive channel